MTPSANGLWDVAGQAGTGAVWGVINEEGDEEFANAFASGSYI